MSPLVECVPNFSEGRDENTLVRIARAIESVDAVRLLDTHADPDHHRSVFTFVGPPPLIADAAYRAVEVAVTSIDLTAHVGEHPRIGAADVVPFVPLRGTTIDTCISLARDLARRIGTTLRVPVFLYGAAAMKPERTSLPRIRAGGFEALAARMKGEPALAPDCGPRRVHPTAGAVAVGARGLLVAFNIFLDTPDAGVAEAIARGVRSSTGGLPMVQAKGFRVRGKAQVSMNLLDIDITPPLAVFTAVETAATSLGARVLSSEFVGLVPARAVPTSATRTLRLETPVAGQILEDRLPEPT